MMLNEGLDLTELLYGPWTGGVHASVAE